MKSAQHQTQPHADRATPPQRTRAGRTHQETATSAPFLGSGYGPGITPIHPPSASAQSASGPQFFDAQAFSPAVAQQAVSGASAGHFPFGDRIRDESQGLLDPHAVPAKIVSSLPGLGVCHDGKVALRSDAGIEVARHELAHAMGADEATAQRAGRSPDVLASLKPGPPVSGWMIGFEFQTVGFGSNPKVYDLKSNLEIPPRHQPRMQHAATPIYQANGWKIVHDDNDIEVVTDPVEENDAGMNRLDEVFDEVESEMGRIQQNAKHPKYLLYSVDGRAPGRPMDSQSIKRARLQANRGIRQRNTQRRLMPNGAPLGPQESEVSSLSPDPQHYGEYGLGVAHFRNDTFTAHPQTTVGVRVEKLASLMNVLADQKRRGPKDRDGNKTWAEDQLGWNMAQADTAKALSNVDKALGKNVATPEYQKIRGVLGLLASYHIRERRTTRPLKNLKNIASFMLRNHLGEVCQALSDDEKEIWKDMLADGRMAKAFGYADNAGLRERFFRFDFWSTNTNWTIQTLLTELITGSDRIANIGAHSMHSLTGTNYQDKLMNATSQFDIGKASPHKGARSGVFLELRKLKSKVPWTQWRGFAKQAALLSRSVDDKR